MKIYEVEQSDCGSYEAGYTIYFDSKQKAVDYCKSKGFYGKDVPGYFKSPFVGKMMLKVGDLLLDVTDKWMSGEGEYIDEDLWHLECDFMIVREVTVH
jgi:hypothetical protein